MDNGIYTQSSSRPRFLFHAAHFRRADADPNGAINRSRRTRRNLSESGQALVLWAVALVVLLLFIGFTVDVGMVYVYMGHLRRAIDSGALAAAAQFRESRTLAEMEDAAREIMHLNGVDPTTITVQTCGTNPSDPALCVTPRRKLVRVVADLPVPMSFLRLVGITDFDIHANAIAEAAAMDVVLVIDISESMANDYGVCDEDDDDGDGVVDDGRPQGKCSTNPANPRYPAIPVAGADSRADDYWSDPSRCNSAHNCHPMEEVKTAALGFVDRVLDQTVADEADRLAIVVFANGWQSGAYSTHVLSNGVDSTGWFIDRAAARGAITGLEVYQPAMCDSAIGPCRMYETPGDANSNYRGINCPVYWVTGDPSSCTTTNIGGGLMLAGNMFASQPREDALWAVVILTDGAANASNADASHTYGFCPGATWSAEPFCRDTNTTSRHGGASISYDADDFARDMADFVGCYPTNPAPNCVTSGQGAVIFAIGLGDQVIKTYGSDPRPPGGMLLRYLSAVGDDGNASTDACAGHYDTIGEFQDWCGNYYFAPHGNQLNAIFEDIASRMFTRLTH